METEELFTDNRHDHCGSSCALNFWRWDVTHIIQPETSVPAVLENYAVIVLNRPITQSEKFVKRVWNNALITMTVDGGTKQWEAFLNKLPEKEKNKIKAPDLITGDFDSVSKDLLQIYRNKGCKIIHTPDQDYTDFTKALVELNIHCNSIGTQVDYVLAFCQCCGRVDHMLGNIQTLFLAKTKHLVDPNVKLFLLTDDAISWLLSPGEHYISIPIESRKRKKVWCSLIPIGEPCKHVTTTGLKWNLDHQPLMFGDLVSTSNTFSGAEVVTVQCSSTLLWSMKIPSVMDD